MSQADAFDRILASLHDSALDDAGWPATFALIDDATRTMGSWLSFAKGGPQVDVEIFFVRLSYRGQRHEELEREYLNDYYPVDERFRHHRQLPEGQLVHTTDLYDDQERRTSPTYNEILPRANTQSGLAVRMVEPDGSRIEWIIADSIDAGNWSSNQIEIIKGLLPHIRHYVRVRQALTDAGALGTSLAKLLDDTRTGVIQLDRRGRIVAANDRAGAVLRQSDGLSDRVGFLHARLPSENDRLYKLLARALPRFGDQGIGGSLAVTRSHHLSRLVLHVSPVRHLDTGVAAGRVAALVLIVDPASRVRIDPELVMAALGLSPAESQVAALLAEGNTVRDIVVATGRKESTIRWHIRQIFEKQGISRQAELVHRVQALARNQASRC